MDLVTLLAAADGVHARDASTLARVDAFTAPRARGARRENVDASAIEPPPVSRSMFFQTHDAYEVATTSTTRPEDVADIVHVFRLRDDAREAIARALVPAGLRKFRRGREDETRALGAAIPGPGSDVSVVRSNRGGYQSYADLLDSDSDEEEAVDDATRPAAADDDVNANADANASTREPVTWRTVVDIALEAYARVRAPSQRADVAPSDVYGWLNVNAPGDYNKLHAHDSADRWSGVLYLAVPDLTNAPGVSDDAGCLGVRASPPPRGVASESSTPYFAHAPRVGDLVVFSGAALHAVSAFPRPRGIDASTTEDERARDDALRVSVAFNVDC